MKTRIIGAIAASLLLALPAGAQQSELEKDARSTFDPSRPAGAWHAKVERTERGFRIGNPEAEASLIEFISYTCGHCADFAREGEAALDMALLAPGEMTVEVRPVLRNAIDLTVSLLVQCGGAEGFKQRHRMFLFAQPQWLAAAQAAPATQAAAWARGDKASRVSLAATLGFVDMLAERGMSRADINACLTDDKAALALIRNGSADQAEFGVTGTPSFALDGELLADVHNWRTLYPVLRARFAPDAASSSGQ